METYEFYPRNGLGPFRLGMTEEEAQAVQAAVPHPFRLEFLDGRLARIGLDEDPEYRVLYRGVDLTRTHAEELIPALAQEGEVECDCEDPELAYTYRIPALGLELWRETVYHPKLLDNPEFRMLIEALPENLEYEQEHGWWFLQVWVQSDDPRANFPLEPGRAPYSGGPYHPAPQNPARELTPELVDALAQKYGLQPPDTFGGGE